ncbi:MAG: hypothetical protein JWO47_841 [Candidatus Saccharibacteria bacterium]|nr:hypothetical protein [Candidatus Saccharibacteria bacterium]
MSEFTTRRSKHPFLALGIAFAALTGCASEGKGSLSDTPPTTANNSVRVSENVNGGVVTTGEDNSTGTAYATSNSPTSYCPISPAPLYTGGPKLTFDDLDPIHDADTQVYPGVSTSQIDKTCNGAYAPGVVAEVICITNGREITSHPEHNETYKTSTEWAKIKGAPGITQFANFVYADISAPDLAVLAQQPPCDLTQK